MDFYKLLLEKAKNENIIKNVVGGIIIKGKKVLMLKRVRDDFMGGILELPSGNMEIGEDIPTSLKREVKEETNLDVNNIDKFINTFDYVSGSGKKARQYNFLVSVVEGNIKLTEHSEYVWLSYDELVKRDDITEEVKYTLSILKFNGYS